MSRWLLSVEPLCLTASLTFNQQAADGDAKPTVTGGTHDVALQEEVVCRMGELLADCIEDTAEMIEKKQARAH